MACQQRGFHRVRKHVSEWLRRGIVEWNQAAAFVVDIFTPSILRSGHKCTRRHRRKLNSLMVAAAVC